jgi:exocyst complex component 8
MSTILTNGHIFSDKTFENKFINRFATRVVQLAEPQSTSCTAVLSTTTQAAGGNGEISRSVRNFVASLYNGNPVTLRVKLLSSNPSFIQTFTSSTSQRQARRNNLAISELFFCDLAQVASEFLKAFSSQAACTSALVVWCNMELKYFASQLIKHYLTKGTQLEMVAKCVESVRTPCGKLTEIGLDLVYHMEGLLRNALEGLIEENKLRILETIGRTEDSWQPYNLQTKSHLKILLKDFETMGIDLSDQVTGDTWINLSQATVNFCRHFLTVTESCAIIAKNESLRSDAEQLLREFFVRQHNLKPSGTQNVDLNFVSKNKAYLVEVLLMVAIKKFGKIIGQSSGVLQELQNQLKAPPKPKPRSIYKTEII